MGKKIILVILAIFLANIIGTIILISTVNSIQAPEVTIDITISKITEDTITIEARLSIDNPNSFPIILENMLINASSPKGDNIALISLPNAIVGQGQQKTITSVGSMGFNRKELSTFHSRITGDVGVTLFGFFTKTIPIRVLLITNPTAFVEAVQAPSIYFDADFSDFTEEGVLFNGTIWIDNQNDFSMSLEHTEIQIEHTNAINVSDFSFSSQRIPPKSNIPIYVNGTAYYTIFNQGMLSATINGNASVLIGGVNMSIPFASTASMKVPDLSTFLLNGEHLIISLSADFDLTLQGLNATVGFRLYNPTKIPLAANNLTLIIYRLDDTVPTVLAQDTLTECPIPPLNETCLQSQFTLPYISFIPKINSGFPEWFQLSLTGDFLIANTTQRIPVTLNGYISPRIFNIP
ncbi:MAG: hypothetical protein QCH96_04430 [Candidatus Thermoplasmatota archaeon]|nr:hypothetical protein [Candidatus Thermoplasmatota archaeon]